MFIQTESTPNPATLKFLPGCAVVEKGTANFTDANNARRSPLATALFGVEGITRVFLGSDFITVSISDDKGWDIVKPRALAALVEHFQSGNSVITGSAATTGDAKSGGENSIGRQIKDLINTRIRPAATQDGGDVTYHSFKDGVVYLEFHGSASSLMAGIENMLRHYVPEVEAVKDHRDALPKPGLETPEGKAIQVLLEEQVNPAVAAHGGHFPGRCPGRHGLYPARRGVQGCGMADVTLKQGVATQIQRVAPRITNVLDVSDHAGGTNPYYQPGKGGMSPL